MVNQISNMDGKTFGTVNTQVFYNMELEHTSSPTQDAGADPYNMVNTFQNQGVTNLTDVSYGSQSLGIITAADRAEAANHKLVGGADLPTIDFQTFNMLPTATIMGEIAQQLIQGKGVFLALRAEQWLASEFGPLSSQPGKATDVAGSADLGGHFVYVVGANTANGDLVVQSWGPNNGGDQGYFKINLNALIDNHELIDIQQFTGFNGIDLSQNAVTREVAYAYNAVLNRAPELSAMKGNVALINGGATLANICDNLFNSAEGHADLAANASNATVVQYLFQTILGRNAESGGLAFYSNELASGMTRGQVAAELITNIADNAHWSADYLTWNGTVTNDPQIFAESCRLQNRAQASEDYAISLQAGDQYGSVAKSFLTSVTSDANTVLVSLVGASTQLGHAHYTAPPVIF
jgi:hypothetical protein